MVVRRPKKAKGQKKQSRGNMAGLVAPRQVPSRDVLEGLELDDPSDLEEALERFRWDVTSRYYLAWEAVVRAEQGLPLTETQEEILDQLLCFDEEEAEQQILYIDESPRPSCPWYQTLQLIVDHLVMEQLDTSGIYFDVQLDGWESILEILDRHGAALSLPPGARSAQEVIPAETRHRLALQICCESLVGIGQQWGETSCTLADPEEEYRVNDLLALLREARESVDSLDWTLEKLMAYLVLPERDRGILVRMITEKLKLESAAAPLAPALDEARWLESWPRCDLSCTSAE